MFWNIFHYLNCCYGYILLLFFPFNKSVNVSIISFKDNTSNITRETIQDMREKGLYGMQINMRIF